MISFPYQKDNRGELFPIVDINLNFSYKTFIVSALIDSGATISVFKTEVAEQLGIEVEKGKEVYLGGVGGRIKGYIHKLQVEIAGKKFILPVVFSHEYLVSLNLLGRDGFFKEFMIIFDEKENRLRLE